MAANTDLGNCLFGMLFGENVEHEMSRARVVSGSSSACACWDQRSRRLDMDRELSQNQQREALRSVELRGMQRWEDRGMRVSAFGLCRPLHEKPLRDRLADDDGALAMRRWRSHPRKGSGQGHQWSKEKSSRQIGDPHQEAGLYGAASKCLKEAAGWAEDGFQPAEEALGDTYTMPVLQTEQPVPRTTTSRAATGCANEGDRSLRSYRSCRQAARVQTCKG